MPLYHYQCTACLHSFEETQSIHSDALTHCRECSDEGATLKRLLYPPTVFDSTPKTVGSLADRNSGSSRQYWVDSQRRKLTEDRKRASEELQKQLPNGMSSAREAIEKAPDPFWRGKEINTGLTELTPKQVANYVKTGDSGA